uniref:Uncharacterized protein n=1 Tax=Rhizophora mucronata TaxID=61149 RepID=A0A2P2L4K1_RHIMU
MVREQILINALKSFRRTSQLCYSTMMEK